MSANFYLAPAEQEHTNSKSGECANLTYENALQWAMDNVRMELYDNFDEWYAQVVDELSTPSLTDKPLFVDMAHDRWNSKHATEEDYEEEHEPQRYEPPIVEPEVKREEPRYEIPETSRERQPIREREYEPEPEPVKPQPVVLPATGNAPIITTQKYDFSKMERKSVGSRIKGGFKRLFGR